MMGYNRQTQNVLAIIRHLFDTVTSDTDDETRILHDVIPKIMEALGIPKSEAILILGILQRNKEIGLAHHDDLYCVSRTAEEARRHERFVNSGGKVGISPPARQEADPAKSAQIIELELTIERQKALLEKAENRRIAAERRREDEVGAALRAKKAAEEKVSEMLEELRHANEQIGKLQRDIENAQTLSAATTIRLFDTLNDPELRS